MSQIRKQSIVSSLVVYIGFAIGFLNTYLFTRQGGFTQAEYGLTGIFMAIANIMYSFANLGMVAYIYKFYPYYNDNLPKKKNDMLSWALLVSLLGFCLVILAGILFKDLVIRKYGTNSPDLVKYYYYVFPFGLGLTLFTVLEAYAWQLKKSVFTNFLREIQFRLLTTLLIVLSFAGIIASFDLFIKIYSFTFLAVAIILLGYLVFTKHISFSFSVSRVSKKFYRKIISLISFVYGGSLVFTVSMVIDTIIIAAVLPDGLALAGVYTLAQNIASLIQAPQRGVISSSIGPLSQAWKDKDMGKISRIYNSSSINQLLFSVAMFALIWLNFDDAVLNFQLQHRYLEAAWVFFFIGMMRIVDMGTGVNSQIISTSTSWRFDFITGIILLSITLPLNYILTKYYYGVTGPAIANLITFTIYNSIRYWFLYKKFNLQPFNLKTIYTILLGAASYYCCFFLFRDMHGFVGMIARSVLFILIFAAGTKLLNLSPDVRPVWQTFQKRLGIKKGD
ncbi:MAG: polysaccharide biosynthesis C-terminal domain-containing protein [Ferruginibacter sp.]|nr:polysaccharide biosynthesis C-terminal domain-containing protein [Chitinophagaceae bacterium]MBP6287315.1 polysaccharide biosynthesis C-terminal domain-containing protein [Ferruginibacter sp.]MBU9935705.1 polysaccharide biosynthesis C-terminal domain-containing protein [Ferruginibacter sp.]HQY10822.1 polysaccharide biosynthesis C-terminal domain-containing protein [Ferruginibacter sp.]